MRVFDARLRVRDVSEYDGGLVTTDNATSEGVHGGVLLPKVDGQEDPHVDVALARPVVLKSTPMPKSATPKKLSKSDYIRSQPESLTAAQVVEKAKEAGIKISGNLVYMVRGAKGSKTVAKKAATPKKATPKKTAAKTSATKTSPKKSPKSASPKKGAQSKADFVRANPGASVKDIVAKALFDGIEISENHVYGVRASDKKVGAKKRAAKKLAKTATPVVTKKPTATPKKAASTSKPPVASNGTRLSGSSVEDLLKAAAAELGLGRALEILAGERARVRAVIGG